MKMPPVGLVCVSREPSSAPGLHRLVVRQNVGSQSSLFLFEEHDGPAAAFRINASLQMIRQGQPDSLNTHRRCSRVNLNPSPLLLEASERAYLKINDPLRPCPWIGLIDILIASCSYRLTDDRRLLREFEQFDLLLRISKDCMFDALGVEVLDVSGSASASCSLLSVCMSGMFLAWKPISSGLRNDDHASLSEV